MEKLKSAEPDLWRVAGELPYKESKSHSCEKDYKPSFPKRQVEPLIPTEIKQLGAPRKNRTFI
jgi:hypothetical protein